MGENSKDTGSRRPATIAALFLDTVARHGQRPAMRRKVDGIWQSLNWLEYGARVRHTGLGLKALGIERGESVCILGDNSVEWLAADMGAIGIGAVSVGIYTTNAPAQIEHIVRDTGARVLFVDAARLENARAVREKVPSLEHTVLFAAPGPGQGEDKGDIADVLHWDQLLDMGSALDAEKPALWHQ